MITENNNVSLNFSSLMWVVVQGMLLYFKLIGKLDWSWWWVFSPIWISALLTIVILIVAFFFFIILDDNKRS